jgi:hypothetical protein
MREASAPATVSLPGADAVEAPTYRRPVRLEQSADNERRIGPMSSSLRARAERQHQTADDELDGQTDTERYRQATDDALRHLDWCIGYLRGIGQVSISRALAHNCTTIRTNLLSRPEAPLPTTRNDE